MSGDQPGGSADAGTLTGVPAGYVRVCSLDELADAVPLAVKVDGEPVAVVRTEGRVHAIRDVCSHENIPLSEGEVEGRTVECWLHGSRFSLETGKALGPPATKRVPVYPVTIDGDDVYVALTQES